MDSALARSVLGDAHGTGTTQMLLAELIHAVHILSWQWGGDDSAPQPERIILPGMPDPSRSPHGVSMEEMDQRLAQYLPEKG